MYLYIYHFLEGKTVHKNTSTYMDPNGNSMKICTLEQLHCSSMEDDVVFCEQAVLPSAELP